MFMPSKNEKKCDFTFRGYKSVLSNIVEFHSIDVTTK